MQNITEINLDMPNESSSPKINIIKTDKVSNTPNLSIVNNINELPNFDYIILIYFLNMLN